MKTRFLSVTMLLILALMLAACGAESNSESVANAQTGTSADSEIVESETTSEGVVDTQTETGVSLEADTQSATENVTEETAESTDEVETEPSGDSSDNAAIDKSDALSYIGDWTYTTSGGVTYYYHIIKGGNGYWENTKEENTKWDFQWEIKEEVIVMARNALATTMLQTYELSDDGNYLTSLTDEGRILERMTEEEGSADSEDQEGTPFGERLVSIEKIYYKVNEEEHSVSLYLVYRVKSDDEHDITYGSSASLYDGDKAHESAYFTYDINKSDITGSGFPEAVSYKTLYAGSEQELFYISTFVINKKFVDEDLELTLRVPVGDGACDTTISGTNYLEKVFVIGNEDSVQYEDNDDFIEKFKGDWGTN